MIERDKMRRDGMVDLTFSLPADVGGPISVVGDFNDWDPYAHPMTPDADGTHRAVVPVPSGASVCFRYLAHGGIWMDDPEADAYDQRGGIVHVPHADEGRSLMDGEAARAGAWQDALDPAEPPIAAKTVGAATMDAPKSPKPQRKVRA